MSALDEVRKLYTEYTGIEISTAIAQVRAELTAQREYEQSSESVLTYKYNQAVQDEIGPVVITQQTKEKKKRTKERQEPSVK